MISAPSGPIKVFLVCSGLGLIWRGYESFTQECFETLSTDSRLDLTLFKGGGLAAEQEIRLWNLCRTHPFTQTLELVLKPLAGKDAYWLEQTSFVCSLLPYLHRHQPDVIYFSDINVGNLLWHWRRLTRQRYKLLFSNGGPLPPPFPRWDHVQQVAPSHFQAAIAAGQPVAKQTMVPYGFRIKPQLDVLSDDAKQALRRQLGLPDHRPLLLSVAAINKSHKRMDYLIQELAQLPEPRPYLLLLGQQNAESADIIQLGHQRLGADNFQVRTVASEQVGDYYKLADCFVLASLSEGLPRVLVEAMSYGLPCLTHHYEVPQFVLGNQGYFADFRLPGGLTGLITQALAQLQDQAKRHLRHKAAYQQFSWDALRPAYVHLIQRCVTA
jgi:glycosyltransferase involved in cell wall biosynthesis